MDQRPRQATVHGVAKSQTQLRKPLPVINRESVLWHSEALIRFQFYSHKVANNWK